jgi:hypothetical protein
VGGGGVGSGVCGTTSRQRPFWQKLTLMGLAVGDGVPEAGTGVAGCGVGGAAFSHCNTLPNEHMLAGAYATSGVFTVAHVFVAK